jgi:hypothetical protein
LADSAQMILGIDYYLESFAASLTDKAAPGARRSG